MKIENILKPKNIQREVGIKFIKGRKNNKYILRIKGEIQEKDIEILTTMLAKTRILEVEAGTETIDDIMETIRAIFLGYTLKIQSPIFRMMVQEGKI